MSATLLSHCSPSLAFNYGRIDTKRIAFEHSRPIGRRNNGYRKLTVVAVTEGSAKSSESEETIPSWAKPNSEEPPPWARKEGKEIGPQQGFEVPFYVYLLASSITAIAAVSFPLISSSLFMAFWIFIIVLSSSFLRFQLKQTTLLLRLNTIHNHI